MKGWTPSGIARELSYTCGHNVTPSVIRKWDRVFLSKALKRKRAFGEGRRYSSEELGLFNVIATFRAFGCSTERILDVLREKEADYEYCYIGDLERLEHGVKICKEYLWEKTDRYRKKHNTPNRRDKN